MRLHILSDLHLEFEPFTPPAVEADEALRYAPASCPIPEVA
jgi:hypothetical protein